MMPMVPVNATRCTSLDGQWTGEFRPRSKCDIWCVSMCTNGVTRHYNTYGVPFTRDFLAHHAVYPLVVFEHSTTVHVHDESDMKLYLSHTLAKQRRLLEAKLSLIVHRLKAGFTVRVGTVQVVEDKLMDTADFTDLFAV